MQAFDTYVIYRLPFHKKHGLLSLTQKGFLFDKVLDLCPICIQAHLESVLDDGSVEHPIGKATYAKQAEDVDCLAKAPNVTRHVEEGIDDALILNHSIRKAKLTLKVSRWVQSAQVLRRRMIHREKVVLLGLVPVPNEKVGVFELHLVIIQIDFFADVLDGVELLIKDHVIECDHWVLVEGCLVDEAVRQVTYHDVIVKEFRHSVEVSACFVFIAGQLH